MNLFCAITDTDTLSVVVQYTKVDDSSRVVVNGLLRSCRDDIPVLNDIEIQTSNAWLTKVIIDGHDVTKFLPVPRCSSETVVIPGPFYRWWHEQSGKGWLIQPVILPKTPNLAR